MYTLTYQNKTLKNLTLDDIDRSLRTMFGNDAANNMLHIITEYGKFIIKVGKETEQNDVIVVSATYH